MSILYVNFDPEADAGYVRFAQGSIEDSSEVAAGLIVDWSADDEPLGLEILYVGRRVGSGDVQSYLKGLAEGWLASRTPVPEAAE